MRALAASPAMRKVVSPSMPNQMVAAANTIIGTSMDSGASLRRAVPSGGALRYATSTTRQT